MKTISQIARFRQSVVGYSYKFSIQAAVNRFNVSRATVYRWRKRYDGSMFSLLDRSRRPHHHPTACITGDAKTLGERFFQYTAIDEYSRFRYVAAFKEQSTYSSVQFLEMLLKAFPFKIECIRTDNGMEFIKSFDEHKKGKLSFFEAHLKELRIRRKLIRPYTPRHNGKVERSHRKDNEYFYATHRFHSFEDFKQQLAVHNRHYNGFPMRPLNWHSPKEYILDYLKDGVLH